jgi:RHS repeat-associated protein
MLKVEYWLKDHLGSVTSTLDHQGTVTARYAYDPFGKRRQTNGRYDDFGTLVIDWSNTANHGTDRGFTGHEHLDDLGLVHMNGRLYDPTIGRFLQGDPFVQAPDELQNYNRYSYCLNGPLNCTDPTGYISFKKLFRMVIAIAVSVYLGPQGAAWAANGIFASGGALSGLGAAIGAGGAIGQAAFAGFISGAISSGSLSGALQGAFTAGMFAGAGNVIGGGNFFTGGANLADEWGAISSIALHGVVGCVTSVAGGGKCGPGALSAAFSRASTEADGLDELDSAAKLGDFGARVGGTILRAVIGGTGSVLGGGKFANGAQTGAFSYLFNRLATGRVLTGSGHHIVPDEVVRKLGITSTDALKVFDSNDARIPVEHHNGARPSPNTVSHTQYNRLALDEGKKWLEMNRVDPSKMTTDQARDMVRHFKTTAADAIRQFNHVQYSKALSQAIRRAWYRNPSARTPE